MTLQEVVAVLNQHKHLGRDGWYIHAEARQSFVAAQGSELPPLTEDDARSIAGGLQLIQAIAVLNRQRFRGRSDWMHCDEAARKHRIRVHAPTPAAGAVSPEEPFIFVAAMHAIETAERLQTAEGTTTS